mgnify:CR=1 FL=1
MGLFDYLDVGVKCPNCGRDILPQTKIMVSPYLNRFRAGRELDFEGELFVVEGYFLEKPLCYDGCKTEFTVRIEIKDNKLTGKWQVVEA